MGDKQFLQEEFRPITTCPHQEKTLRTSSYTIYVDLPDTGEEMLLVHGYLGSYDKVSRSVAAYLRSLEVKRPPKPLYGVWRDREAGSGEIAQPSEETIKILRRRGYLTTRTPEDEEDFFKKFVETLQRQSLQKMPSYIFMLTYSCNLRCPYCFQDSLRTNPKTRHLLRTIEPEAVDRIFKALPEIEAKHGITGEESRSRPITFFGGEPFLAANRGIVEYIINKARANGKANFHAISNATELHAYKDLLSPDLISRIQVTLDGPPPTHDTRRIYPDGSPTFEKIAGNIEMALALGTRINVRVNLNRENLGDLPQLADEIKARGWDKKDNFSIYAAAILPRNKSTDPKTTLTSKALGKAMKEIVEKHPNAGIVGIYDDVIKKTAMKMFSDPKGAKRDLRASFCGANRGMYLFDAFADIYACWEITGDCSVRIGRVTKEGGIEMNAELAHQWRGRTVATNPVCSKCRYALHCGGGCSSLAKARSGKLHTNYCDGFATRFRDCIAQSYREHVKASSGTV